MWPFYVALIVTALNVGSGMLFGKSWGRTRIVRADEGYTFYRGILWQLVIIAAAIAAIWAGSQ